MTVGDAALFSLATAITSLCLVAAYAVASWKRASAATRKPKSAPDSPTIPSSEGRFARIEADLVELFSALERITSELKRISSRQVRREEREAARETPRADAAPPPGATKAELRRHYGLVGLNSAQIASKAQQGVQLEMINGGKEGS